MGLPRKATNISIDASLQAEARELGVNISRAAEDGLRIAVRKAKEAAWKVENAGAIAEYNKYIEENGLPLADLRMF